MARTKRHQTKFDKNELSRQEHMEVARRQQQEENKCRRKVHRQTQAPPAALLAPAVAAPAPVPVPIQVASLQLTVVPVGQLV